MDKKSAIQALANAAAVATQAINDYGKNSPEARSALTAARAAATTARQLGATDAELLAARPA